MLGAVMVKKCFSVYGSASRRQLLLSASVAALMMVSPAEAQQTAASAWEGAYIGVHGGYGGGDTDSHSSSPFASLGSYTTEGGFGGVQAGYNWELAGFLVGLEGDVSFGDIEGDSIFGEKKPSSELDWMATARARIGVLITPSILAYATGGVAWGEWDDKLEPALRIGGTDVSVGWTIGGGVESKLTDTITIKLEYLYIDFGDETYKFDAEGELINAKFDHELHTVKVGLNIKLN